MSNTFYINLLTKFKSGNVNEYRCECQTKNNMLILISTSSSVVDKGKDEIESISNNDIENNTAVMGVGKDMEDEDDDDFEDNDDDIDI